jgi:hypothetical protein
VASLLACGRFFGDLLKRNPSVLDWVGRFSGALLILGVIGILLGACSPPHGAQEARCLAPRARRAEAPARRGEQVYIIDLRHPLELVPDPFTLPGASLCVPLAYDDLRDWIKALEKHGELKRIREEVSPELEITEITDRVSRSARSHPFRAERRMGHRRRKIRSRRPGAAV